MLNANRSKRMSSVLIANTISACCVLACEKKPDAYGTRLASEVKKLDPDAEDVDAGQTQDFAAEDVDVAMSSDLLDSGNVDLDSDSESSDADEVTNEEYIALNKGFNAGMPDATGFYSTMTMHAQRAQFKKLGIVKDGSSENPLQHFCIMVDGNSRIFRTNHLLECRIGRK